MERDPEHPGLRRLPLARALGYAYEYRKLGAKCMSCECQMTSKSIETLRPQDEATVTSPKFYLAGLISVTSARYD